MASFCLISKDFGLEYGLVGCLFSRMVIHKKQISKLSTWYLGILQQLQVTVFHLMFQQVKFKR